MVEDRPPVPAEREALDRPWRIWASVAVVSFVLLAFLLGFLVVPERGKAGFDPFTAMCRALGIPGFGREPPESPAAERAAPASEVAWTSDTRRLLASADVKQGAQVAESICLPCHGMDGVGTTPIYPHLVRQSAAAIFKQMQDYRSGKHQGAQAAIMTAFAQMLDDRQIANVAAYYASQRPSQRVRPIATSPAIVELARIGDPALSLPPCEACHAGSGGPIEAPVLLGQSVSYLEQQLQAFASGERRNDIFARMRTIAQQLTPEEIRGLSLYYSAGSGTENTESDATAAMLR
jgi:cytochrome c553